MDGEWSSQWISPGNEPTRDLGVFVFRREIDIERVHARLDVRVSADQRYKLFANGELVGFGPQRGDLQHWFYETYDLAPFLKKGRNEIRAVVWNFGWNAPMAQMSARTAFLLDDLEFEDLSTPKDWQVAQVPGWDFAMMHGTVGSYYMDIGPGEIINAGILGTDIATKEFEWRAPHIVCQAMDRGADGGGTPWMLVPRTIPPMRYDLRGAKPTIRHGFSGDPKPDDADASATFPIHLRPGGKVLLDYGELLCAYPRITALGEAELTVTFAEACFDSHGKKNNRDHVKGMQVSGYQDKYIVSPQEFQFETLWWRTYRYVLIEANGPASISSIEAVETGYPFEVRSAFEADDPLVKPIWAVSVRTAERCAGESYFDCPYYEQLQYAGDTRIQALIGYYLSTDRALQRAAVKSFQWSTLESGLTQSRYPSRQMQIIPPFSLWWLAMLADQRLYDRVAMDAFELEGRIEGVSSAFTNLAAHPEQSFWNFADWVPTWPWGVPVLGARSVIHRLTEFYARLLNRHAVFENCAPDDPTIQEWIEQERVHFEEFEKIDGLVREHDEPPSEHAESLYRLCQIELGDEPDPWPFLALERSNAARCTYYFSYYKHLAMQPDDYMAMLGPWKEMIEDGLTTFAENPEPTRSDCHAWSAHPILGFFQIVAGVTSSSSGWRSCRIEPRPGRLRRFKARIAHFDGLLQVTYEAGKIKIDSPVPYEFRWRGKAQEMPCGRAIFE